MTTLAKPTAGSNAETDFITVLECEPDKRATKLFRDDPRAKPHDYDAGEIFRATEVPLKGLADLLEVLETVRGNAHAFAIAGRLKPDVPITDGWTEWVNRRKHDRGEHPGPFESASHRWLCLDFDTTEATTLDDLRASLPEGMRDAECVWLPSANAHRFDTLRGKLWVWLDRAIGESEAKALCKLMGADASVMQAVQPIFIADPIFEGCSDPLPSRAPVALPGGVARVPVATIPAAGKRTRAAKSVAKSGALETAHAIAERMPPSVEGHGGDEALFKCARELATVLEDDAETIESVIAETFNPRCLPPWPASKLTYEAARAAEAHARNANVRAGLKRNRPAAKPANDIDAPETETAIEADDDEPMILQKRTDAAFVLLRHPEHGYTQVAPGALRLCITELGLPIETQYETAKGTVKQLTAASIIEGNGRPFGRVAYDFSQPRSRFEPGEDRAVVGYPPPRGEGLFDQDVDTWLRALAGDQYDRVCAWIAACAQHHITELAAALVLIGPANIGKTLFACACAGMWNETPVKATLLIARFNGDMSRCPIVFDDEAQLAGSGAWSTKNFREAIQSTARNVELKGKEMSLLMGALRLIIACNDLSDLKFTDVGGADIVGAVGDRLAVVDAKPREAECAKALLALRRSDSYRVDMPRLVGHFRWIAESTEIPTERFVGASGGRQAVIAGHVAAHPAIFDDLVAWVEGKGGPPKRWSVHEGELCVDPAAPFGDVLSPTKRADVDAALAPLVVRKIRPSMPEGQKRPVLRVLSADLLGHALDIAKPLGELLQAGRVS